MCVVFVERYRMPWLAVAAALALGAPEAQAQSAPAARITIDLGGRPDTTAGPADRLAQAACTADRKTLERSIAPAPDFTARRKIGDTEGNALFLAAACFGGSDEARLEIVERLLDAGAKAETVGRITFEGMDVPMTALIAAAYNRRAQIVEMLLARGASPRETDGARGGAALHWAAESNCLDCVTTLISAGADIDARNGLSLTPLYVAAIRGDAAMTKDLLDRGASPFAKDAAGTSVAEAASEDAIRALLQGAKRKRLATYAAWALAGLFLAGIGVYGRLRGAEGA